MTWGLLLVVVVVMAAAMAFVRLRFSFSANFSRLSSVAIYPNSSTFLSPHTEGICLSTTCQIHPLLEILFSAPMLSQPKHLAFWIPISRRPKQ